MYEGVDCIYLDGLEVKLCCDYHEGPEGGTGKCGCSCRKVSSCLLIPTHYEAGLTLLQEVMFIYLIYEYPHQAEYSLAFRMYLVCFNEGFHLLMGLKVVPLRLLESVSEGVRFKISI